VLRDEGAAAADGRLVPGGLFTFSDPASSCSSMPKLMHR